MGRYAQLVIGPAGSGKSTYCDNVHQHCSIVGRSVHIVNLDPAADEFKYPVSFDIRDLISLEDAMEELELGPNGGLLYCMEYLEENLETWLGDELEAYGEDDYLLFDCPGQIELYSHVNTFRALVDYLKAAGWNVAAVYCLDCQFVSEAPKFVAGALQALSAMALLEVPHVNLLTKVDLLADENKEVLRRYEVPDSEALVEELQSWTGPGYYRLNLAIGKLLDEWSLLSFNLLDYSNEDSLQDVLAVIDNSIQFGEDADVKIQDLGFGEIGAVDV